MGDWDIVRKIMEKRRNNFWKIKISPRAAIPVIGKTNQFWVGNPVSSHLVFSMIVCPWFQAFMVFQRTNLQT